MKHLIIGAGYFGYNLAVALTEKGQNVIVFDKDIKKINALRDIVFKAVQVDVTDQEMLEKLVPADLDQAIVCIGSNIEVSLLVTLHLQELKVKNIISKCHSTNHEKLARLLGVKKIIDPEKEMAKNLAIKLTEPDLIDFLPIVSGYKIVKIKAPKMFQNKYLKDVKYDKDLKINIIGIKKELENGFSKYDMTPRGDTFIKENDTLIIVGSNDTIETLV